MSHFSVAVILSKDHVDAYATIEEAIEPIMAPYQENNMGDCPQVFLEFHEYETEFRERWETESCKMWELPDGTRMSKYDESLTNPAYTLLSDVNQYLQPDGSIEIEVPLKERFPDFDEYMTKHCGFRDTDKYMGQYGHWENPNAKWDYWRLGGRWLAALPIKQNAASAKNADEIPWEMTFNGENHTPDGRYDGTRADACLLADIDWDAIDANTDKEIAQFVEDLNKLRNNEQFEDPFIEYNIRSSLFNMGFDMNAPYPTLTIEDIQEKYRHHFTFSTYAVVDEDRWYEAGSMGWFGISYADPTDVNSYRHGYKDLLQSYDQNTHYIAIVDCHI